MEIGTVSDVIVLSKTEDKMSARVTAVLAMLNGISYDENGNETHNKETRNINLSIIKEGSAWKIDSFKFESTK